jgi:cytoplasmic iron level regulating protein YaaA (DUF328/UPF0246 family)
VLILLPPSEGKSQGASEHSLDLDSLSFGATLTSKRREVLERYGWEISEVPLGAAIEIYTGVLYQALSYNSLSPTAKSRADSQILIFSALFGVLRLTDQIPYYKLKMKSADWSGELPQTLDDLERELIVDCRSSTYSTVWRPDPAITVQVKVFQVKEGKRSVITHMSKKFRGELTRALLQGKPLKNPQELGVLAQKAFNSELLNPSEGQPYQLNLLIPAP